MRERNELLKTIMSDKKRVEIMTILENRLNEYKGNKSAKSFDALWELLNGIDEYEVEYNIINDKGTLHYSFSLWNNDGSLEKTYETEMELV